VRIIRLFLASVFLLTGCCGLLWSQTSLTSLRGTITDPSGALIPGATVRIENKTTTLKSIQTSTNSGEYVFAQIVPGTYVVTVDSPGFGSQSKEADILVNQPATINFQLTVQSSTVTVDVSSEAQTLNNTDASIGNSVNNATIQALPMEGRNVTDLLSLQPGVLYLGQQTTTQADQDSRSGSVAGARSDQTNVTLDGLDDNDQQNGYAFTGVLRSTLDSTEEFRVTTTSSNADAGRSSGAQVTLVTKSGTNQFHGAAYEYNRTSFGYANDWFNKQGELASGLPNRPGKLIRNTFGASLGGPIWKNKLFFFFNYEGQRTAEDQQVTQTVPSLNYRQGIITYQYCVDPNDPTCAQTGTQSLSAAQVATLDAPCTISGVCTTPGPNSAVLAVFQQYPAPNGASEGDGYNLLSYTFSSPYPGSLNTTILKLDYEVNNNNHLWVRGALQQDTQASTQQFPGQPASSSYINNNKGIVAGETWTIKPTLVNDIRYGYIRQGYANSGIGVGDYTQFRFISQPIAETRSDIISVPVNNIVDNVTWTKGSHTFGGGANWRLVHNNRGTDNNSFNLGSTNPYWTTGGAPDPSAVLGLPPVSGGFSNSYQIAYSNLVGAVPQLSNIYNYSVSKDGTTGNALPDGAFINRHFKANEYEWYIQDAWRVLPNLTITYGIRQTILQTPYEENGQQVSPTIDTDAWFRQRNASAAMGETYEPLLEYAPNGPAHHAPGYWAKQKTNFAPRFAIAFAPDPKTSIRAGWGMYFDHYGEGIVNTFDQNGSFGLSTGISNPAGVLTTETAPRFTSINTLPNIPLGVTPPTVTPYPYTPPAAFQITWGADNKLKTPYAEAMDFSVQREVRGGFTLEFAYVGRLGRHLLQALDLAEPVNFVDPHGGGDYFSNATQLSKLVDANGGNAAASVPAIPYFEDVFPYMANVDYPGESATQAIYSDEWAPNRYYNGETTALADINFYCYYTGNTCPAGSAQFWQPQFSSLYAWSSIGMSYYNAGQITLRHPMSHGLQADFSYTFSKSVDLGSDAERASEITSNNSFSSILNTWNPSLNRAVSDFDTTHLITFDWVYQMPFGHGQKFANSTNRVVDELIGGWEWTGVNRWTSGLPFGVIAPGWATNWQIESFGVNTGPVKIHKHQDQNGAPQVFANPAALNNGVEGGGSPIRLPYPGEAGERNAFRGDGYFELDSGLAKTFQITERQGVQFTWQVFNVTNSVRFDTNPNTSLTTQLLSGTLGNYSATLSKPRVMQFSLRYSF
jgi:Carboxypeptidase regulatory-like domain/TonB dependent receptor